MKNLLSEVKQLLDDGGFDYAFCGGMAVDLFLGYESRKHSDVDLLAYWPDRERIIRKMQSLGFLVYEMIGGGKSRFIPDDGAVQQSRRNIFCCKPECELVPLIATEEAGVYWTNFQHVGQTKLNYVEFLFNERTDEEFIYAGNANIRRRLEDAILEKEGMTFLAPELCLLYKASTPEREGYQQDYELALAAMTASQRKWLTEALTALFPEGHQWNHQ